MRSYMAGGYRHVFYEYHDIKNTKSFLEIMDRNPELSKQYSEMAEKVRRNSRRGFTLW